MQKVLKSLWKASPQHLRLLFCAAICLLKARKRIVAPEPTEPVYVCGPFANNSGVGCGARLYAEECRSQGKKTLLVDITSAMHMRNDGVRPTDTLTIAQASALKDGGGTVVVHANPPQFQLALCALGKDFLKNRHITAYWSWELEQLPLIWKQAFDYADTIETPSTFVREIVRQGSTKPVYLHPHILPGQFRVKSTYAANGVLRCLYIFDAGSSFERKNPLAALKAFAAAFAPGEATLTFKIANSASDAKKYTQFRNACARVPGVRIITDTLDSEEMANLYLEHDVYLSLHRSEGFGLTILEAMRHGLYAVATAWSGNMDFMTGNLACPVPFSFVDVNINRGAFKGIATRWAEPDIDAAVDILRNLRHDLLAKQQSA